MAEALCCLHLTEQHMDLVDSEFSPTLQVFRGNVVTNDNRGVFTDSSMGLVLYYHYANTNVGLGDGQYLFGWNKLSWSNGWPYV